MNFAGLLLTNNTIFMKTRNAKKQKEEITSNAFENAVAYTLIEEEAVLTDVTLANTVAMLWDSTTVVSLLENEIVAGVTVPVVIN